MSHEYCYECPTCNKETTTFIVRCDGYSFMDHYCSEHGHVRPILVIHNTPEYHYIQPDHCKKEAPEPDEWPEIYRMEGKGVGGRGGELGVGAGR